MLSENLYTSFDAFTSIKYLCKCSSKRYFVVIKHLKNTQWYANINSHLESWKLIDHESSASMLATIDHMIISRRLKIDTGKTEF